MISTSRSDRGAYFVGPGLVTGPPATFTSCLLAGSLPASADRRVAFFFPLSHTPGLGTETRCDSFHLTVALVDSRPSAGLTSRPPSAPATTDFASPDGMGEPSRSVPGPTTPAPLTELRGVEGTGDSICGPRSTLGKSASTRLSSPCRTPCLIITARAPLASVGSAPSRQIHTPPAAIPTASPPIPASQAALARNSGDKARTLPEEFKSLRILTEEPAPSPSPRTLSFFSPIIRNFPLA